MRSVPGRVDFSRPKSRHYPQMSQISADVFKEELMDELCINT